MQAIEYITRFKEQQLERKSENTIKAYISDLKSFDAYLKTKRLGFENINNKIMDTYIADLMETVNQHSKQTISPKTVNRHLVSINTYIRFINSQDDFENKIFVQIQSVKVQKQYYLENLLEKNEFVRMITKAKEDQDERAYVIFSSLYYTGGRVSELLQFTPQQINSDTLIIKGKGDKYREIILADDIIDILEKYIKKNRIEDDQRIFPMTRQTVHKIIKKYAGKCRINLKHASAHKFRHLHAIDLLDNGATIEEVADDLGHSDINMARIYTRKTKKELKKTINKLSQHKS